MIELHGTCKTEFLPLKNELSNSLNVPENEKEKYTAECGVALCIIMNNEIVVNLYGGFQDQKCTKKWNDNTLAGVYSCTKGWTSIVASHLRSKKILEMDAPVCKYWKGFEQNGKEQITVKQLLCHESGCSTIRVPIYKCNRENEWDTICNSLASGKPFWPPGSASRYHAFTFGHLVGNVCQLADGKGRNVGEIFKEEITDKFGISDDIMISHPPQERCAEMFWHNDNDFYQFKGDENTYIETVNELVMKADNGDQQALAKLTAINPQRPVAALNSKEFQTVLYPASGGWCSAKGMASLYSKISNGEIVEKNIISKNDLKDATITKHCEMKGQGNRSLGFTINTQGRDKTFGHGGRGGHVGFGDYDYKLGIGFVRNRLSNGIKDGTRPTGYRLAKIMYECLDNMDINHDEIVSFL